VFKLMFYSQDIGFHTTERVTMSDFRVSHPTFLEAWGDEHQLVVFRSPVVRDDDPWYQQVLDHIRENGLEPADQEAFGAVGMMFARCEASWYLSPVALRDGLLAAGRPQPLRAMCIAPKAKSTPQVHMPR